MQRSVQLLTDKARTTTLRLCERDSLSSLHCSQRIHEALTHLQSREVNNPLDGSPEDKQLFRPKAFTSPRKSGFWNYKAIY